MKRQRSLQEYRVIDLAFFAGMLLIFEFVIVKVSRSRIFWDQPYTVSLAAAITSIVYMRWGYWGALHAAFAGFWYCFCVGGTVEQYMVYIAGNLFSVAAVPVLKRIGPEKVRKGPWSSLLFPLAVILLMQGGRAVVSLLLGNSPAGVTGFFTTDSLSILFTLVIIWIARRLDGIYEDQRHYLLRIHAEEEQEQADR